MGERIVKKKIIKGTYGGSMEYKRYEGITKQEFYDLNEEEVEKYLGNKYTEANRQRAFSVMYTDIIGGD